MSTAERVWGMHLGDGAERLEELVHDVYEEIARRPAALRALKEAMAALLSYLASPEGRTDSNCRAVDIFFCIRDQWETDWEHLPPEFRSVLEDIGGTLHDSVSSPQIARNFDSTPELLLARVKELSCEDAG